MLNTFFGTKIETSQAFDDKGNRVVVTKIKSTPLTVTQVKSLNKDGYQAVQCAIGKKSKKSLNKPQKKHLKGAKLKNAPKFLREIRFESESELKVGDQLKASDVFKVGDKVKATGKSIGRGFTGVIKRWGFSTGPRTHGQSDRWRSPGSIGQRSDPGRVWKGKKMAGHSGNATRTMRNLQVLDINEDQNILTISGTVPSHRTALIKVTKTGKAKRQIKLLLESKPEKEVKETKKDLKKSTATKKTKQPKKQSKSESKPKETSKKEVEK